MEVFQACPARKQSWGRPRTLWRDYIFRLIQEQLGILLEELLEVAGGMSVWDSLLKLLPYDPGPDRERKMRRDEIFNARQEFLCVNQKHAVNTLRGGIKEHRRLTLTEVEINLKKTST